MPTVGEIVRMKPDEFWRRYDFLISLTHPVFLQLKGNRIQFLTGSPLFHAYQFFQPRPNLIATNVVFKANRLAANFYLERVKQRQTNKSILVDIEFHPTRQTTRIKLTANIDPNIASAELLLKEDGTKREKKVAVLLALQGVASKRLVKLGCSTHANGITLLAYYSPNGTKYYLSSKINDKETIAPVEENHINELVGFAIPEIALTGQTIQLRNKKAYISLDASQCNENFILRMAQGQLAFPVTATVDGRDLLQ